MNRRQFVRGSLLLGGAMLAAACSAPAAPSAPTAAPKAPEAKPADAKPAAAAPATTSSSATSQYKLDLGGYKGPAPTDKGPAEVHPPELPPAGRATDQGLLHRVGLRLSEHHCAGRDRPVR